MRTVGITLGIVLLAGLALAWWWASWWRENLGALHTVTISRRFVNAIRDGSPEAAYEVAGPDYSSRHLLGDFKAEVARLRSECGGIRKVRSVEWPVLTREPGRIYLAVYRFEGTRADVEAAVKVTYAAGRWSVVGFAWTPVPLRSRPAYRPTSASKAIASGW